MQVIVRALEEGRSLQQCGKCGQGEGGGLAVGGHPFAVKSLLREEKACKCSFYHHLPSLKIDK